jgi:hypothetical protein
LPTLDRSDAQKTFHAALWRATHSGYVLYSWKSAVDGNE